MNFKETNVNIIIIATLLLSLRPPLTLNRATLVMLKGII